ncbi:MAG: hypothetical protein A2511_04645 [Deltaproteobacteria bacterium RIFOXYD12_FULL_50_9]|nr:MAG: hypothetical protein A2511_04645 [Deltaproteobacteria bacterium RIFOXYD12_FULL_50_9]
MIERQFTEPDVETLFEEALALHQKEDLKGAREIYWRILRIQPNHAQTLHMFGVLTYELGNSDEAVRFIRKSIELDPDCAEACIHLGMLLKETGHLDETIGLFRRAIDIDAAHIDQFYNLSLLLASENRIDEAIEAMGHIMAVNSEIPEVLHSLGLLYFRQNRLEEAAQSLMRAVALSPENPHAYKNLALALLELSRDDEAITALEKAIALDPGYGDAHFLLGGVFRQKNQAQKALTALQTALVLAPDRLECHNEIALACMDLGLLPEAAEKLELLIAARPQMPEAHYNLGLVFQRQHRLAEAEDAYRKSIALKPDNPAAYNNLGLVYNLLNRKEEALACYQQALALDPQNQAAGHLIAALTQKTTRIAPEKYVVDLFDQYSENFEHDLVCNLEYTIPTKLKNILLTHLGSSSLFHNALDMGCGTGMCGEEFVAVAERLTGVDLSAKMLEKARKKMVYDRLTRADVVEFLTHTTETFDLFISTDVFIYIGELESVFAAVAKRAAKDGYFIFSVESCNIDQDYVLRPSGRYAQSQAYIATLAETHGFTIELCQSTGIRKEEGLWIMGHVYILKYVKDEPFPLWQWASGPIPVRVGAQLAY